MPGIIQKKNNKERDYVNVSTSRRVDCGKTLIVTEVRVTNIVSGVYLVLSVFGWKAIKGELRQFHIKVTHLIMGSTTALSV